MRADGTSAAARVEQPMRAGHLSLGQFYIGSGDVPNRSPVAPRCHSSLNIELDRNSGSNPVETGDQTTNPLPRVTSLQLNRAALQSSSGELKVSDPLAKQLLEVSQPASSCTRLGPSDEPPLLMNVTTLTPGTSGFERQVAFQPRSRVCELVEDTWPDSAPNGGWGWLVVLGSFLCMFVVDGVCFSYGMYMREMIVENQFTVDDSPGQQQARPSLAALTLPGALLCGTYLLIGPIAGALVNRFDYRRVAMVGAILVTISFTISALWLYDLRWFTIVFGLVGGIGFGLIYLPAITVVGHWFEQRRAFVVGVAMCGGGLGSGVVAALVRPLARHVALRGTLILTAALFCQTLLGIALFRPLYVHELIQIAQRHHRRRRQEARYQAERAKKRGKKGSNSTKHNGERKAYFQRGSIMARIIEEKSRQRTTSTGSLDGMVITRENELAALSDPDAYEALMAAAAAYADQEHRQRQQANTNTAPPTTTTASAMSYGSSSDTTTSISTPAGTERSIVTATATTTTTSTVPGSRGHANLQTVKEGVALPSNQSNTAPVAVLPPPVQFSHTAVRRIACAILRKLQLANVLPGYLSFGAAATGATAAGGGGSGAPVNRNRSGQFYSPLIGAAPDSRTESWTAFDAMHSSKLPLSEHTSAVYDSTDPDEASLRDRYLERKTSLNVTIGFKKLSLRNESLPQSDLNVTEGLKSAVGRERSASRNATGSRLLSLVQTELSRSPSQLASMISLDSRTDELIARELHLLPLDAPTKDAVLIAMRAELCRPKYRADFFYSASRKPSANEADMELRPSSAEPGSQFRMAAGDLRRSSWKRGASRLGGDVPLTGSFTRDYYNPMRPFNYPSPVRIADATRVSREQNTGGTATGSEDPGQRLRHWLSGPIELEDPVDETLAYLREMLDWRLLSSGTFLVLLVACSLNMLVLLVPFHFLPLLLEFGGMECRTNPLWCPDGLPRSSDQGWLVPLLTWSVDSTAFVSPGAILLIIGLASIIGRLLAALYIEKGLDAGCRTYQRFPCLGDPLLLNNVLLVLCGLSLACFPLALHGVIVTPSRSDRDDWDRSEDGVPPTHVQAWTIEFRLMMFCVAAIVYGMASAISLSLRSVILVELFGIRRLTNAFGYLLIFQGLAVILGPPLFGCFCDAECHGYLDYCGLPGSVPPRHIFMHNTACTKRLVYAFYICAALFLVTSVLFMPLRWLARRESACCASCRRRSTSNTAGPPAVPFATYSSSQFTDYLSNPAELYSIGSGPGVKYDPQQTQTTQILSDG